MPSRPREKRAEPRPARRAPVAPPPIARALALPAVLAAAALVHAPALGTFFAQDDVTFLARARGVAATPWSLARPLSEGWTWRALHAAFGLDPLPYHLFTLALHLGNTALVYAIGRRLLGGRPAALAAGLLFGASSIAFTPLHWTSGLVELMAAGFALGALLVHLVARERGSRALPWLAALLALGAVLSKESAILVPLALLAASLRLGPPPPSARTLLPPALAMAAYAAAFLATIRLVHHVGSEVYAMSHSPLFVLRNLATYLAWLVSLHAPVRDAHAAMDPGAWPAGLAVALAVGIALWSQRRAARHPEEVGLAWFVIFLAPVVALRYHTYLYYLYLPWAGACWFAAGLGRRLLARAPAAAAPWAAAAALAVFAAVEAFNVRARERATVGPFARDKTVREASLLQNAVAGLDAAGLAAGDRIAFVNPAPRRHVAMADTGSAPPLSYIPLEGAMRGGETIRVFFPGVEYLGFASRLPREWEDAEAFLYQDEGTLRHLGRGSRALAELGTFMLRLRAWDDAEAAFLRSRERGDTLADATFGLVITGEFLGRPRDADRYAEEFLRRWPDDPRAAVVAGGGAAPPAR